MLREGQGKEEKTSRGPVEQLPPPSGNGGASQSVGSKAQGSRLTAGSPVQAPLAQALVRVDVGFATGARVRHILEVVDEAGDQAAAQITPESEMGRPEEKVPRALGLLQLGGGQVQPPPCKHPYHLPHEAAKEAQHEVHQANLVGDLGGDGLLAVRTHCLHRCTLKDFSLQHCHRCGSP